MMVFDCVSPSHAHANGIGAVAWSSLFKITHRLGSGPRLRRASAMRCRAGAKLPVSVWGIYEQRHQMWCGVHRTTSPPSTQHVPNDFPACALHHITKPPGQRLPSGPSSSSREMACLPRVHTSRNRKVSHNTNGGRFVSVHRPHDTHTHRVVAGAAAAGRVDRGHAVLVGALHATLALAHAAPVPSVESMVRRWWW